MTQVAEPLTQSRRGRAMPPPPNRNRGQLPVVIALIVALAASGLTQYWAAAWKDANVGQTALAARGALSGMDSYALALMLGGLRGPLVMVLWSKVENQKIDRDLEDVDAMIEWIRLLQPEFDTVHIFQIWNKAYNISVMMASPASKYLVILDAVDYARRVDADRPGDINILGELAQVYTNKLGGKNVSEREFYRRQFREDSLTDANREKAYPEDRGHNHRLGIKYFGSTNGPILDADNNIIGSLLAPKLSRPADLPANSEWNDGSELQYLAPYQPFTYGMAPSAMGYNYAKRAQVAMTVNGQRPLQISSMVIDSGPALDLKQWAEVESDRGINFESRALPPPKAGTSDAAAAPFVPGQPVSDLHALDAAIFSYNLSARLCGDAIKEYERHLAKPEYFNQISLYASHKEDLDALRMMDVGNRDCLAALKPGADAGALFDEAKGAYRAARAIHERIVLQHDLEDPIVKQLPIQQSEMDRLSPEQLDPLYRQAMASLAQLKTDRIYDEQRNENIPAINRCTARLAAIEAAQKSVLEAH